MSATFFPKRKKYLQQDAGSSRNSDIRFKEEGSDDSMSIMLESTDTVGDIECNTENISYSIQDNKFNEKEYEVDVDIDSLLEEINNDIDNNLYDNMSNENMELSQVWAVEYSTNYTVQGLSRIMEYYGLNKRKLRKDEIIQLLVMFECDLSNQEIVIRRRRLWKNIDELKQDKYFSKYILF